MRNQLTGRLAMIACASAMAACSSSNFSGSSGSKGAASQQAEAKDPQQTTANGGSGPHISSADPGEPAGDRAADATPAGGTDGAPAGGNHAAAAGGGANTASASGTGTGTAAATATNSKPTTSPAATLATDGGTDSANATEPTISTDGEVVLIRPDFGGGSNGLLYHSIICDHQLGLACDTNRQSGVDGLDLEQPGNTPSMLPQTAATWLAANADKHAFLITGLATSTVWGVTGYTVRLASGQVYDDSDVTYAEVCPTDRVFIGMRKQMNTADRDAQMCAKLSGAFSLGATQDLVKTWNFGIHDECPDNMIMIGTTGTGSVGGPYTLHCAAIVKS